MSFKDFADQDAPQLTRSWPDLPAGVHLHVLGTKFTSGGEAVLGTLPLRDLFMEKWPADVHFTMYTSPAEARLVKGGDCTGIKFEVAVVDLDYDEHRTRPTLECFHKLTLGLSAYRRVPNVIYQTRGGARLIYLITPITDPLQFEDGFRVLLEKLSKTYLINDHCFRVDLAAKDWTRLFRAPLVTRDGVEEFENEVRVYHDRRLDLTTFQQKPKATPFRQSGSDSYCGHDRRISCLIAEFGEGNRNNTLYKLATYITERYRPSSRDYLLKLARKIASGAGLAESEIEQVIKSAGNKVARVGVLS